MSQPPPPSRAASTLPTAVQALIGCIAAGGVVVGAGYLAAMVSTLVDTLTTAGFLTMTSLVSLATVGTGLLLARKLRRRRDTLGWAIGIYLGLLLGAIFWAGMAWLITAYSEG